MRYNIVVDEDVKKPTNQTNKYMTVKFLGQDAAPACSAWPLTKPRESY